MLYQQCANLFCFVFFRQGKEGSGGNTGPRGRKVVWEIQMGGGLHNDCVVNFYLLNISMHSDQFLTVRVSVCGYLFKGVVDVFLQGRTGPVGPPGPPGQIKEYLTGSLVLKVIYCVKCLEVLSGFFFCI